MTIKLAALASATILLFLSICSHSAEISYQIKDTGFSSTPHGKPDGSFVISFSGLIDKADILNFKNSLDAINKAISVENTPINKVLVLKSSGGDIATAMAIGRIVRKHQMLVVVRDSSDCYSSCVYLLASGVQKYVFGNVGIHRPYFKSEPKQNYDISLKQVLGASREYFYEMNIPEKLADEMFSTPPEDIHVLTDKELYAYRLNTTDIAFAEERAVANAKTYKLSRVEYEQRLLLARSYNKECISEHQADHLLKESELMIYCLTSAYKRVGLIVKD